MNVRVATYNLFEGAGGSYNRLVEFVRTAGLDVVCLQEINGWQDNDFARLKDFTDKTLFAAYAYGNSNTEYKLATVSKHAINSKTLHAEAFWHAALETRLMLADHEVTVVNVHLDPWKEDSREREILRLLSTLQRGQSTIITGDFNSLSRRDTYPADLLEQLRAKGISKYGTQRLEYRVIDRLLEAGYVDAAALQGVYEPTVPSASSTDKDHEVPVRVDYLFVSPDLAPLITAVERVRTDLTDAISDHYPLVVTFRFDGPQPALTAAPAMTTPAPESVPGLAEPLVAAAAPAATAMPAAPPSVPAPTIWPRKPVTPWVPEGYKDDTPPADAAPPPPSPQPPQPADGAVIMWSHDSES